MDGWTGNTKYLVSRSRIYNVALNVYQDTTLIFNCTLRLLQLQSHLPLQAPGFLQSSKKVLKPLCLLRTICVCLSVCLIPFRKCTCHNRTFQTKHTCSIGQCGAHNATTWQLHTRRSIKGNLIQRLSFFIRCSCQVRVLLIGLRQHGCLQCRNVYKPFGTSPVHHVGIGVSGEQKLHAASNSVFFSRSCDAGHEDCPVICRHNTSVIG